LDDGLGDGNPFLGIPPRLLILYGSRFSSGVREVTRWHRTFKEPGFYRTHRLSNGQRLRMGFRIERDEHATYVCVEMVVYRGLFRYNHAFEKEGVAVGPGGSEVFPLALQAMADAEQEALRRIPEGYVTMEVGAATLKLAKIYKRYLLPLGYFPVYDYEYAEPILLKDLR